MGDHLDNIRKGMEKRYDQRREDALNSEQMRIAKSAKNAAWIAAIAAIIAAIAAAISITISFLQR
jgi:type IV secretory pathway component VirB8